MKKYVSFCIVAALSIMIITVQAQPRGQRNSNDRTSTTWERPANLNPKERAEYLAKELDLTKSQKTQVQKLYEKRDAEMQKRRAEAQEQREARQGTDADRDARRQAAEAERKAHDDELKKIIGEEKFQKLQEIRQERMQNANRRNNGNNRPNQRRSNSN